MTDFLFFSLFCSPLLLLLLLPKITIPMRRLLRRPSLCQLRLLTQEGKIAWPYGVIEGKARTILCLPNYDILR
jgi:hypothetical protein